MKKLKVKGQRLKVNRKGFLLIEVLLSTSVFILAVLAFSGALIYGQENVSLAGSRSRAVFLAEEGLEIVRNIRDNDFSGLADGTHGLAVSGANWAFSGSEDITDIFTRQIEINSLNDTTKIVTSTVTWQQNTWRTGAVSLVARFVNWLVFGWTQTTEDDFNLGNENSITVSNVSGGEVALRRAGSWANTTSYLLENMTGGQNVRGLFVIDNNLYIARASSANPELYVYDLSDVSGGSISETANYDLGRTPTGLHIYNNVAYFSTTSGSNDLAMIDLDSGSITEINVPGGADATDVYVAGGKILVTKLEEGSGAEFFVYDLTGTLLGQTEVGSDVNAVTADNNYAYLATGDSSELWTVDYNDCPGPANDCTVSATYNPTNGGGSDATAITHVGTNVYMGRANNRFHGFDASNISNISEFLDYDNRGDSINDIFVDEDINFLFAVTDNAGSRELRILDISSPSNPQDYEVNLDGSANAYRVLKQGAYVYVGSADGDEIQVLKGGQTVNQDMFTDSAQNSWSLSRSNNDWDTSATELIRSGVNSIRTNYNDSSGYLRFNKNNFNTIGYESFNFYINTISPWAHALYGDDGNGAGDYGTQVTVTNSTYANFDYNSDNITTFPSPDLISYKLLAESEGIVISAGNSNYTLTASELQNSDSKIIYVEFTNTDRRLTIDFEGVSGTFTNSVITNGRDTRLENYISGTILNSARADVPVILQDQRDIEFREDDSMEVNGLIYAGREVESSWLSGSNRITVNGAVIAGTIDGSLRRMDISYATDYHLSPPLYFSPQFSGQTFNIEADIGSTVALTDYLSGGIDNDISTWELVSIPLGDMNIADTIIDRIELSAPDSSETNLTAWFIDDVSLIASTDASDYSRWGIFTSSEFDSGNNATVWNKISWTESGTGEIKLQLRTAPDSGGSPGTWSAWMGPTSASDYYTDSAGGDTVNSAHSDGSNDQWAQYRGFFTGNGSATPALEDITLNYN